MSVKMVQRSKGRSATGAIAYRAGADIVDERTGLRFNYKKKRGVSHNAIVLPVGAPEKYRDRGTLWNAVEQKETKSNSAVAREYECALPYDLPRAMREQLGLDFAQYIVDRFGVAADINFHDPHPRATKENGEVSKNYHFHLLTSTRVLTSEGFTEKTRILDSVKTGSSVVEEIRAKYAEIVNDALARFNLEKFVDHRSNERRGIDVEPQIHVGPNQDGDRAEQNASIIAAREHLAQLKRQTAAIQLQIKNLLVEQTLLGETIPLFALEPATTEEPQISLDTVPDPPKPDPRQLEFDFATSAPVAVPHHKTVEPRPPENVIHLDKVRRFNELEQLQKKAGVYGRAIALLSEHRGLAASFQRELDALDKPGLLHRFWNSKRWRDYEDTCAELSARVHNAKVKAHEFRKLAKEYKPFSDQWDIGGGYAEHKTLAKELTYGVPVIVSTTYKPQPSYSPLNNDLGMG